MESTTYVGLDVHKSVVVATAVDPMGNRIDQRKLGPTDGELTEYLRGLPGQKQVALEATTVWEHFYDAALRAGASPVLSNPLKTRLIAETSLKSDRVDAEALATLLRLRAIPRIYVPEEETRTLRHLVRERYFYGREASSVLNRTYAQLIRRGIEYPDRVLRTVAGRRKIRALGLPDVSRAIPFVWTKDAESILRKVRKIQRLSVTAH